MFRSTQSLEREINLLELADQLDEEEQIQSFSQLKTWMNAYEFQKHEPKSNIPQIDREHRIRPTKTPYRPSKSIEIEKSSDGEEKQSSGLLLNETPSSNSRLGDFLNVRQSIPKTPQRKNSINQENPSSLNQGLTITYEVHNTIQNEGSIKQSSAHSSRSFNGNQKINQYEIGQKLGHGAFSAVYHATDLDSTNLKSYAIKILNKKQFKKKLLRKNSEVLADNYISNEIALLKKMDHPHITKLHEVINDEEKGIYYLVLEYCANGYINEQKLKKSTVSYSRHLPYRKLLESECKRYLKQLALAMDYVHNVVKIAHRDIKPENILLSENDEIKLSDFGLGTEQTEVISKSGTKLYLAPQMLEKNVGKKVNNQLGDIWAIGITIVVMLTGKNFEPTTEELESQKYLQGLKELSSECKDFIKKCLQINPEQRMTAKQMLTHPWLNVKQNPNKQQPTSLEVTEDDKKNAIIILKQLAKLHIE